MSGNNNNEQRTRLTAVQTKVLGRKFCTTCQRMAPVEDGREIRPRRWLCGACLQRRRTGETVGLYDGKASRSKVSMARGAKEE